MDEIKAKVVYMQPELPLSYGLQFEGVGDKAKVVYVKPELLLIYGQQSLDLDP